MGQMFDVHIRVRGAFQGLRSIISKLQPYIAILKQVPHIIGLVVPTFLTTCDGYAILLVSTLSMRGAHYLTFRHCCTQINITYGLKRGHINTK